MKTVIIAITTILIATVAMADGKAIPYTVDGDTYEGYYISPTANAPLVLLIHDWDGLTEYEIKRSKMLSDLGYAVFAADLFGAGVRPTKLEDKQKLTGELYKDRKKMRQLMMGALETAASLGADTSNAVAMGYCFGGTVVLELARAGVELKGFVPFHGGLTTPEGQDYAGTEGKILVFHGTTDKYVTMSHFAELAMELEKHGIYHEMITYSGAPHAFTVFGSDRYREEPDRKSWKRFVQFLEETLKSE